MEIEQRLAALESALRKERDRNRWWPLISLVSVVIASVFAVVATKATTKHATQATTQPPDILNVKSLVVSDNPNGPRVTIRDGQVTLSDPDRGGILELALNKNMPSVILSDSAGNPRILLTVREHGPCVFLLDSDEKPRMMLTALNAGPSVELLDSADKTRARLGGVSLEDANGRATTYSESSFALFGPDGKVLYNAVP